VTSETLLVPYDPSKMLRLACNESYYGLGSILFHQFENDDERPVSYASRIMNKSERKKAQMEHEALSLIFGVNKFHDFLYVQIFTLVIDHKPLLSILGPKSGVPNMAAARIQRWALLLSAYDYDIEYRNSSSRANCDALSRLPNPDSGSGGMEGQVFPVKLLDANFPVLAEDFTKGTKVDSILSKVHQFVLNGWPLNSDDISEVFKPFHHRRDELSCEQDWVLCSARVVIPKKVLR